MKWVDIILPYRFWIKRKHADSIAKIEKDFLPKSYDASLVLPEYRKKIKQLNDQADNSSDDSKKINDLKQSLQGVNKSFLEDKGPYIAAAEASIFLGYDAYSAYQSVDEYVYEGMSRLSGENLDNLADLSTKVQSYDHDFWGGLSDAGLSKVGGHIGEAYAADSLQDKGFDVQWAQDSNQAGWDLLVNGHEMNVKIVADANSLSQHFNEYPDIPVIIPGDAANIPEDAINIGSEAGLEQLNQALSDGTENIIAVDPNLSGEAIMSHTEQATDFATGAVDAADVFFPYITAAMSTIREMKILGEGHTSISNSAKNIGLDVAGTATGAAIGGAIGAGIGTAIMPGAGTVVGKWIGGAAGAYMGKRKSDEIKNQAFTEAFQDYTNQKNKFEREKRSILINTNASINKLKQDLTEDISSEKEKLKSELKEMVTKMKSFRKDLHTLKPHLIESFKKSSLTDIQGLLDIIQSTKSKTKKWKAIFFPTADDFAMDNIIESLENMKIKISSIDSYSINHKEFLNIIGELGLQQSSVLHLMAENELLRYKKEKEYQNKIDSINSYIVKKRHQAISRISKFITQETNKAQTSIKEKVKLVLEKIELVNIEKRKLGIK